MLETEYLSAVRDSRGRYYLYHDYAVNILVFDSAGKYLTSIGRNGEGPGEYRGIGFVRVASRDTIMVFDNGSMRWTVLSPQYRYVRSTNLEVLPETYGVTLGDGRAILNSGRIRGENSLHLVGNDGRIIRSFGSTGEASLLKFDGRKYRVIAPPLHGTLWTAYHQPYIVQQWDTAGRLLKDLRRRASWFPFEWQGPKSGPEPHLVAVWESADGLLWTVTWVADLQWRKALRTGQKGNFAIDDESQYDTMIEVIDPKRGEVVTSRRLPNRLAGVVGDQLIGSVEIDDDGTPRFAVWRVRLRRPSR